MTFRKWVLAIALGAILAQLTAAIIAGGIVYFVLLNPTPGTGDTLRALIIGACVVCFLGWVWASQSPPPKKDKELE